MSEFDKPEVPTGVLLAMLNQSSEPVVTYRQLIYWLERGVLGDEYCQGQGIPINLSLNEVAIIEVLGRCSHLLGGTRIPVLKEIATHIRACIAEYESKPDITSTSIMCTIWWYVAPNGQITFSNTEPFNIAAVRLNVIKPFLYRKKDS